MTEIAAEVLDSEVASVALATQQRADSLSAEQLQEAEALLAKWGREGDSVALNSARAQSEAVHVYAKRNGFTEIANQYARLKIHAEAAIGSIDRRLHPSLPRETPWLEMGYIRVDPSTRRLWRTVAIVAERGLLTGLLDDLGDFTWADVRKEMSRRGLAWAAAKPLHDHIKKRGLTYVQVEEMSGIHRSNVRDQLNQGRMRWTTAVRIAEAVGFDALSLPPEPSPRQPGRQAEWARRRREAEAALAREHERRQIKRALRSAGKALSEAYAAAERMQDVIAQAHREASDREVRRALSVAGEHHRKMRDEIVRALGVGS